MGRSTACEKTTSRMLHIVPPRKNPCAPSSPMQCFFYFLSLSLCCNTPSCFRAEPASAHLSPRALYGRPLVSGTKVTNRSDRPVPITLARKPLADNGGPSDWRNPNSVPAFGPQPDSWHFIYVLKILSRPIGRFATTSTALLLRITRL